MIYKLFLLIFTVLQPFPLRVNVWEAKLLSDRLDTEILVLDVIYYR